MQKLIISLVSLGLAVSSGVAMAGSSPDDYFRPHQAQEKRLHVKMASAKPSKVIEAIDEADIYTQGLSVTTSPFIGIRSKFDASDLIVNLSTMNEDLRFLQEQQKLSKIFEKRHLPKLDRPLIELSGDVVGQTFWQSSYRGHSQHDLNLTGARFDVFAHASSWATGYISTDFDNSPLDESLSGSGFRLGNSRIFLKRAFLTIGNLDAAPVYFSMGQMYVPFGRYASGTVTTPSTVALAQTNTRAALFGLSYDGFYGSVYGFRGDSDVDSTGINQWGVNAGYHYTCNDLSVELGAGYIANIADSSGMQLTGHRADGEFSGFGEDSATETLDHRVPAYDVHFELGYGPFGFNTEYIATTRHFAAEDMSFNDEGAKPTAFHVEANYRFDICELPAAVNLAYGRTEDALALGLPKNSLFATFNISLWKNTIQSIEYRYDQNYDSEDISGGQALVDDDGGIIDAPGPVGGGHRNLILAQIGVYF
jgi:predicted porin